MKGDLRHFVAFFDIDLPPERRWRGRSLIHITYRRRLEHYKDKLQSLWSTQPVLLALVEAAPTREFGIPQRNRIASLLCRLQAPQSGVRLLVPYRPAHLPALSPPRTTKAGSRPLLFWCPDVPHLVRTIHRKLQRKSPAHCPVCSLPYPCPDVLGRGLVCTCDSVSALLSRLSATSDITILDETQFPLGTFPPMDSPE